MSSNSKWASWVTLSGKLGGKVLSLGAKLLKTTKVVKLGLAGASAVSYTLLFSWKFTAAIMVLLFVHESGHVWAMRRRGIKTKGFYFIPFIGGAAVADEAFGTRDNETYIALMGPTWGLLLSLGFAVLWQLTGNALWAAVASWMALVNLINMLPVNPLDGGRILKSVLFSISSTAGLVFMLVGSALAIALFFKMGIFIFAVLFLIGILDFMAEYNTVRKSHPSYVDDETSRRKARMSRCALADILSDRRVERYLSGLDPYAREAAKVEIGARIEGKVGPSSLSYCAPHPSSIKPYPPMGWKQNLFYSSLTVALVGCLFSVMSIMDSVPGAALAKNVLFDREGNGTNAVQAVTVSTNETKSIQSTNAPVVVGQAVIQESPSGNS